MDCHKILYGEQGAAGGNELTSLSSAYERLKNAQCIFNEL